MAREVDLGGLLLSIPKRLQLRPFWVSQLTCLTFGADLCSSEQMRPNRLQNALAALGEAIGEVTAAIEEMRTEHTGPR